MLLEKTSQIFIDPSRQLGSLNPFLEISFTSLMNEFLRRAEDNLIAFSGIFHHSEIADQQSLLKEVVSQSPIILWVIDEHGVFRLSEGMGLSALGLKPGETIGKSVFEIYADQPQALMGVRRSLAGIESREIVRVIDRYYDSWQRPLFSTEGKVRGVLGVATDVTQRVLAQKETAEFEQRFRAAFHHSPAAITVTDIETGRFIDANDAYLKMIGLKREETIGKTTLELGLWKDPSERALLVEKVLKGETMAASSHVLTDRQGRNLSVQWSASVIVLDGRKCMLSCMLDMTARAKATQRAELTRQQLRTLGRLAPVAIFRTNAQGEIRQANGRYRQLVGDADQANSLGCWIDRILPEDLPEVTRVWKNAVKHGQSCLLEFRMVDAQSRERWILLSTKPLFHKKSLRSFVGTLTDITARKRAEAAMEQMNHALETRVAIRTQELRQVVEELEVRRSQWESLVRNAPDIILRIRTDRTIEFVNRTEFGWQPEDLIHQDSLFFVHPDDRDDVERVLHLVFTEGTPLTVQLRSRKKTGETLWYAVHIGPVYRGNSIIAATAVLRDITQQKFYEEEAIRRRDELAHASRLSTIGEMAAMVAHELNQPLAAIANFVRGAVHRLQEPNFKVDEIIDGLEKANRQAQRAGEMIHGIRRFLRKRDSLQMPIHLPPLVHEAWGLAEIEASRYRIQLETEFAPALPLIIADDVQIVQVLLNLFLNGIDAMKSIPQPERKLIVRGRVENRQTVVCEVEDRGTGFSPKISETMFDAFITTKEEGLGLGLSVSRSIVEAHGGRLRSFPNHEKPGVTFQMILPIPADD